MANEHSFQPTSGSFLEQSPSSIVNVTTATVALTRGAHADRIVTLNRAGGIAAALPAATGSGDTYRLLIGTTFTSPATIKVANATDVMTGRALMAADGGDTFVGFETAADTDTVTLNGSTTGGFRGDMVELIDMASGFWWVRVVGAATGAEATPFSATVS